MIPKIIHCIWFGGAPYPPLVEMCLASWRRYCPDYEIMKWDENNFDIDRCRFAREAHAVGKWAFVADLARLAVLREHGGIYMDTDVELKGPLDKYLHHKAFGGFCGDKDNRWIFTALFGAERDNRWITRLLSYYDDRRFIGRSGSLDETTNVRIITQITRDEFGVKMNDEFQDLGDVAIYPADHFGAMANDDGSPIPGEEPPSERSVAFHHCLASWTNKSVRPKDPLGYLQYKFNKIKQSIVQRARAIKARSAIRGGKA